MHLESAKYKPLANNNNSNGAREQFTVTSNTTTSGEITRKYSLISADNSIRFGEQAATIFRGRLLKRPGDTKWQVERKNTSSGGDNRRRRRRNDEVKTLEERVMETVLNSSIAGEEGEVELALARARESLEALNQLRAITTTTATTEQWSSPSTPMKQQASNGNRSQVTTSVSLFELGLMVNSNLAAQLKANGHFRQAIELYTSLCRLATSTGAGNANGNSKPNDESGQQHQEPLLSTQSSNHLNSNFNFNFNLSPSSTTAAHSAGKLDLSAADSDQSPLTVGGNITASETSLSKSNPIQYQTKSLLHKFGLNIGNVYYQLTDYKRALKYYRLTLDRLSSMTNLTGDGVSFSSEQAAAREADTNRQYQTRRDDDHDNNEELNKKNDLDDGHGHGTKFNYDHESELSKQKRHSHHHPGSRQRHQDDIRQLKLKLMNNISQALFEQQQQQQQQQQSNKTINSRLLDEETLTSLRLLLADNLVSRPRQQQQRSARYLRRTNRRPECLQAEPAQQQVAGPETQLSGYNANHHSFALNEMVCRFGAAQAANRDSSSWPSSLSAAHDLIGALRSLVKVKICHNFERVFEFDQTTMTTEATNWGGRERTGSGRQAPPLSAAHANKNRALNSTTDYTNEQIGAARRALVRRALGTLANDKLEIFIRDREEQISRSLLLSCQLILKFDSNLLNLIRSILTDPNSSLMAANLVQDLTLISFRLSDSRVDSQKSVKLMREIEQSTPKSSWSTLLHSTNSFVKLSRGCQINDIDRLHPVNLSNNFLLSGDYQRALEALEDAGEKSWLTSYNSAIVKRLSRNSTQIDSIRNLLRGNRKLMLKRLSSKANLSLLQLILLLSDDSCVDGEKRDYNGDDDKRLKEARNLLTDLLTAGSNLTGKIGPEVLLLASKLLSSQQDLERTRLLRRLIIISGNNPKQQEQQQQQKVREAGEAGEAEEASGGGDLSAEPDSRLALSLLQQANREYPFHLAVLERLIALNINNFAYKRARELIISCIKNRPDQVRWFRMLAECYRRATDYKRAAKIYKLAIGRFPQDSSCLRALIKMYDELGLQKDKAAYEIKLSQLVSGASNSATE